MDLLLSASLVFLGDQICKRAVVRRLAIGQSVRLGWLTIRHARNTGRGPCFLGNRLVLLSLWGLALTGIVLSIQGGHFFQRSPAQAGLGAALGGAAGNLCDRFRRGAVIDFVDVGCWPVFNLADVAITLGVITALWWMR